MFLNYSGLGFGTINVGQQKQAFSHEVWASSNDMMFTERSLMSALTFPIVDRAIGVRFDSAFSKQFTVTMGAYGDTIKPNSSNNTKAADEGWGFSGRTTYAPIAEKDKLLHFGLAGAYREPNANDQITDNSLALAYETTHMSNLKLVEAKLTNLENVALFGGELAGMYGPFSLEAEYTKAMIQRNNGSSDLSFDGWYAQAGWTLTGESRNYQTKDGRFVRLQPHKNFSFAHGGLGAWELAFRLAGVNLNDKTFAGGDMTDATFALNWYVNKNVRFMADYTHVLTANLSPIKKSNGGQPDDLDIATVRAQWAF